MAALLDSDPRTVSGYTLHSRLGEGAYGVVYAASHARFGRVALKVLRPTLANIPQVRARLRAEAQALQRVQGNCTAAVLEVNADAPVPYLALELVEGLNLFQYVSTHGPFKGPILEALKNGLVEALASVHAANLVHRDLKPTNIMFGPAGVKVLDFGISVLLEVAANTGTDITLGTETWMSPEQAQGDPVGQASDVFNLGMVLAYAATGVHPFGAGKPAAVVYRVVHELPNLAGVPSSVLAFVAQCLQKDALQRPDLRMHAVADTDYEKTEVDLGPGVPPLPPPPPPPPPGGSWIFRVGYGLDRPILVVLAFTALFVMFFFSVVAGGWQSSPAQSAAVVSNATAAVVPTATAAVVPTVVPAVPKVWREKRTLLGHTDNVNSIAFSSDGRRLATASRDRTVKIYVAGVAELSTLVEEQAALWCVAFSRDDSVLAVGSEDGSVKLIDSASGRELHTLIGHSGPVYSVAFSLDGKSLATGSKDSTVKLWDTAKGIELKTLDGHSDAIYSLAFSPDGTMLASGSADRSVGVWYLLVDFERRSMWGHAGIVYSVAFSPDSGMLASGARDNTISLQPLTDKSNPLSLTGHTDFVRSVAYSPDGTLVASGSGDNSVILWDAVTGGIVQILTGHARMVRSVAFSPDGRMLASASEDRTIILWEQIPSLGRGASVTPAGSGINASAQAVTLPPSPGFSQVRYTSSRQIWHLPQQ